MYSWYSEIQKEQLFTQTYIDTQAVSVGVYAPKHSVLAAESLTRSIHQNVRVFYDAEQIEQAMCDVVVVMAVDGEFMSTALMHFVLSIQEGNDFCWSDAVFGKKQNNHFFATEKLAGGSPNTVAMSGALFLQSSAECGTASSPRNLIQCAARLSRKRKHIPLTLITYRRPVLAEDVFAPGKKRALILSHEFSMTGAPIVLTGVIPVFRDMGFDMAVWGPAPGEAMKLFQNYDVPVITNPAELNDEDLLKLTLSVDLVWANTVIEAEAVGKLNGSKIPVIWWLHDAFACYSPWLVQRIIEQQMQNVKIYAAGNRVEAAMRAVRPNFQINELLYGLPDYTKDKKSDREFFAPGNTVRFTCVGSIEERKGQDILVDAILHLPESDLEKAQFVFVGKVLSESIYGRVLALTERYPKNVSYIPFLSREEIKALMTQCDCLICPSRDEPMGAVVTEAIMFGKPAIISENTGYAGLATNGKECFIYGNDDPEALCEQIQFAIRNPGRLKQMQKDCRLLYEEHFSQEAFARNVRRIIEGNVSIE